MIECVDFSASLFSLLIVFRQVAKLEPTSSVPLRRCGVMLLERLSWARAHQFDVDAARLLQTAADRLQRAENIEAGSGAFFLACVAALRDRVADARHWLELTLQVCRPAVLPTRREVDANVWLKSMRALPWFIQWRSKLPQ